MTAASKPAAVKWTKPGGVTAILPKQNLINVTASVNGVCGAVKKIPLWIKVQTQNEMSDHPTAGIVQFGSRSDGRLYL